MSESAKVHDLPNITCNLGGIALDALGGWNDGGGFSFKPGGPYFTTKVGADGSVVRSKTGNMTGELKLDLFQTAGANALLSTLIQTDIQGENGAGVVPLLIRDRSGNTVITASKAWITGLPEEISFKQEVSGLSWTVFLADATAFLGGS